MKIGEIVSPKFAKQDLVGYVVENNDPDKRQRVKIRVAQLHRNVPDEDLPWAIPDASQSRANAGAGAGSVNVPVKGAKVYVRFEDNDPHNPRYSGSPTTDDVNKDNELLKENYPHSRGTIDDGGNRHNTNVENETHDYTHKSGTTVFIDANGNASISSAGNIILSAQGSITIVAKGEVNITGSKINLNEGSDSAGDVTARQRPKIQDPSGKNSY